MRKGTLALTWPFPELLYKSITNIKAPVGLTTAAAIAQSLEQAAKEQGCDKIELVYNEFKNVVTSKIKRSEVIARVRSRLGYYKSACEVRSRIIRWPRRFSMKCIWPARFIMLCLTMQARNRAPD